MGLITDDNCSGKNWATTAEGGVGAVVGVAAGKDMNTMMKNIKKNFSEKRMEESTSFRLGQKQHRNPMLFE